MTPSDIWGVPEIREVSLSPDERAQARDNYVRAFDHQFGDWATIAKVCIDVEKDQDYKLLGFASFHAWLLNSAPRSRSYLYLVMGRYKELSVDIPEEELREIPLGSAGILKQLSPAARRSSKIRLSARGKPSELRRVIETEAPDQAIEAIIEQRLHFTASQWDVIFAAYESYQVRDPGATIEVFFEWLVTEVCQ